MSTIECVSYLCPGDRPFRCKDNKCGSSIDACEYPTNVRIVKQLLANTQLEMKNFQLNDQSEHLLGYIRVPSTRTLKIRGLAFSEMSKATFEINPDHEVVYASFYGITPGKIKLNQILRSAVVSIVDLDEDPNPLEDKKLLAVQLKLKVDLMDPIEKFEGVKYGNTYCLGRLVEGIWKCSSSEGTSNARKFGTYIVNKAGIYAVMFWPDETTPSYTAGAYCGYLCQNKKYFLVFWLVFVPMIIIATYIILKFFNLQTRVSNVVTENFFLKNKMEELENVQVDFTGQTVLEKIDEGVQYFNNALRNEEQESIDEFKTLNVSLVKLREETRKVNAIRNRLINANKLKLEEIRVLRNKLGEYE